MTPGTRRLAAILSADVGGYSRLMAEDEAATIRTLGAHQEQIGVLVREQRGRVVDTCGDNLLDALGYENGALDQPMPFSELKARSHINERAEAADRDPHFSVRIREGLPRMSESSGA